MAGAAILDSAWGVGKIPPAFLPQRIQRAIAEQAVIVLLRDTRMTGEHLTFPVAEIGVMASFLLQSSQPLRIGQ